MSTHTVQPTPLVQTEYMRSGTRYEIDASCRFWWTATIEQAHFGSGRISNLSVAGVSVSTPILPLVGSSIMLEIDLPRSSRIGREEDSCLLLAAEGKVLRHHPQGDGFAACITHSSFAKNESFPSNQEAIFD